MKKLLTYIVLSILVVAPFAQSLAQNRQCFDGGMMVHTGYLHGDLSALNHKAKGMTFGLGGVLRYHLGNHFRLGGEGYVSTLKQMHNGSYIRTSWGGLLADAYWQFGRWQPFAGVTIGGGKTSSLLMFEGSADDWEAEPNAFLHNESFFFVNPNIGVEFALTEAVHLTLKVDRLIPVSSIEMPTGVRCYLGLYLRIETSRAWPVIDNLPMLIVVMALTIPIAILAMRLAERVMKKSAEALK